jgi:hypothetical protein
MENLRKKNQTETLEIKSSLSPLQQTKTMWQLEDKINIKGKTEELLDKRFKSFERNTKELSDGL